MKNFLIKKGFFVITTVVLMLSLAMLTGCITLLEENFDDGKADDWVPLTYPEDWSVQMFGNDGEYIWTNKQPTFVIASSIYSIKNYENFYYEAEIMRPNDQGHNNYGIIFRYLDDYNFAEFFVNPKSKDYFLSVTVNSNVEWSHNGQDPVNIKGFGEWNKLKIECEGTIFNAYINDVWIGQFVYAGIPLKGKIGLSAWGVNAGIPIVHFDNVKVTYISPTFPVNKEQSNQLNHKVFQRFIERYPHLEQLLT